MNKKLIWILVMIFIVSDVHGLGLAPASSRFDFEAGVVKEGAIRIITEEYPSKIVLTKEGDLGRYIELEKEVIVVEQAETWIDFKLNLPEDMPPGERRGGILVLEIPKDTDRENVVLAAPAVVHQVKVNVPYPGKYVTGKMYITNIKLNDPVIFTLALKNFGKENVENAKATITIKGPTNEEIAVLRTDEKSIKSGQEGKLLATWEPENPGSYIAEAVVEYDGEQFQITERFNVGDLEVEIERIEVNNFKIGQIAKLDIHLRNKWNKELDVGGRVEIFKDNKIVSTFNALPVSIREKSTGIMNAYWNTEDIETGEYDVSVKANYGDKTSERTFTSIVSIDDIQFKNFVSGQAISGEGKNNTPLLVGAVIILIVLNILLFIYINKKLKSRQ